MLPLMVNMLVEVQVVVVVVLRRQLVRRLWFS
jgi:hypothetical protein